MIVWDVRGERRLGRPFRFAPVADSGEGRTRRRRGRRRGRGEPRRPALRDLAGAEPRDPLALARPAPCSASCAARSATSSRSPSATTAACSRRPATRQTVVWDVATRGSSGSSAEPAQRDRRRRVLAGRPRSPPPASTAASGSTTSTGRRIDTCSVNGTLQDLDFSSDGKLLAAGLATATSRSGTVARRLATSDPRPRRPPVDPLRARRHGRSRQATSPATSTSGTRRPGARSGGRSADRTATSSASPTTRPAPNS